MLGADLHLHEGDVPILVTEAAPDRPQASGLVLPAAFRTGFPVLVDEVLPGPVEAAAFVRIGSFWAQLQTVLCAPFWWVFGGRTSIAAVHGEHELSSM